MSWCNSDKSLMINRKTFIIKGLLFGKSDLLRGLRPYKLKACTEELPGNITQMSRWETGTINFEGIAGITAVIDYIASLGVRFEGGKETFRFNNKTRDNKPRLILWVNENMYVFIQQKKMTRFVIEL